MARHDPDRRKRRKENEHRGLRRRALRAAGFKGTASEAANIAQSPRRFAAELEMLGTDPSIYGKLAEPQPSGPPRSGTPAAEARSRRYHYLRACGLRAAECTEHAGTPGTFARRIRQLARDANWRQALDPLHWRLPPLPPELEYPGIPSDVPRAPVTTEKEPA